MKFLQKLYIPACGLVLFFLSCTATNALVKLTAEDSGTTIQLKKQQSLQVSLTSNASTGYRWVIAELDSTILTQSNFPQYVASSQVTGAAGKTVFTFKPLQTGSFSMLLVYKRTWETEIAPIDSFYLHGNVMP